VKLILFIAVGGAFGAVLRHTVGVQLLRWLGSGFPFSTLAVNIVGSFAMGALVEVMALRWQVGIETRAFLMVGLLGGFTTFSAFSFDVVLLYERGAFLAMAFYLAASITLSVFGLVAGLHVFRAILT
jgi:CrcB protein